MMKPRESMTAPEPTATPFCGLPSSPFLITLTWMTTVEGMALAAQAATGVSRGPAAKEVAGAVAIEMATSADVTNSDVKRDMVFAFDELACEQLGGFRDVRGVLNNWSFMRW